MKPKPGPKTVTAELELQYSYLPTRGKRNLQLGAVLKPEDLYSCWTQIVSATGGTPAAEAPTWENLPPVAKQRWTMLALAALNCIAIEMRREHDVAAASITALSFRQHEKFGRVQAFLPRDSAGRPTL